MTKEVIVTKPQLEIIRLHADNIREHLDELFALQRELTRDQHEAVANALFVETATHPDNFFVAGFVDETLVAMGLITRMPPHPVAQEAHINNVVVRKAYRGMGFATAIMDELHAVADRWNVENIQLSSSRPPAQCLYRSLGYDDRDTICFVKRLR